MPELLLELLSEEIPARMQARAAEDLKRLVTKGLKDAGLDFTDARAYVTPRRLVLVVDGLPKETQPGEVVQRGPRIGSPQQAIDGFLKSVKRASVDDNDIYVRETNKGEFYFFEALTRPRNTLNALPNLLADVLDNLPWPKSMRWRQGQTQPWVRPLRRVLAIFDGEEFNFLYNLIHTGKVVDSPTEDDTIFAGNTTFGHRFLSPGEITVKNFADYQKKLRAAHVMLDPAERRETILGDAEKLAKNAGLTLRDDAALLDEVTGLVEWPVVLMGRIDDAFMDLPPEVLRTAMRTHQKYFSLIDGKGAMAPRFVVVANIEAADGGAAIVAGNERVLRARLADAKYFWDQDRKVTLESRLPALEKVVFHAKLGTVAAKSGRMERLAAFLAQFTGCEPAMAGRAALLCKADLTTQMVGEFPELQGVMGRYYAQSDGEDAEAARAIAEHHSPAGPAGECPTAPVAVAVALADRIDTLAGFFAIDEKPTGSKDPFALRRAALGVIRLIVENGLRIPLSRAFGEAAGGYGGLVGEKDGRVCEDLLAFIADRLKVHLREKGVRHDLIDAVFALGGEDDLVRLLARVDALGDFLASDDGANLLTAYRRAANIVVIEEKKDDASYDGDYRADLLDAAEEKHLATHLKDATSGAKEALSMENFTAAMAAIAGLRRPVDDFFDSVTVNVDDAARRANRLRLLSGIGTALDQVADFSCIEGGRR